MTAREKRGNFFPMRAPSMIVYVRTDPCSFANFYVLVNNGKRIHLYIRCQPGVWMNISMRVNHEGR
jgi:hypothetical protein